MHRQCSTLRLAIAEPSLAVLGWVLVWVLLRELAARSLENPIHILSHPVRVGACPRAAHSALLLYAQLKIAGALLFFFVCSHNVDSTSCTAVDSPSSDIDRADSTCKPQAAAHFAPHSMLHSHVCPSQTAASLHAIPMMVGSRGWRVEKCWLAVVPKSAASQGL